MARTHVRQRTPGHDLLAGIHPRLTALDDAGDTYQVHIMFVGQLNRIAFDVMDHGPASITVILPGLKERPNPFRLLDSDILAIDIEEL